MPITLKH